MEERTEPAEIPSADALFRLMESELGYCGCAYTDAVPFLHELLRRVAARTDSVDDSAAFQRHSEELEAWMLHHASGGVASWIVSGFQKADLLHHGWNVFDLSITEKGRRVLVALDRFPDPQPRLVSDDGEADDEDDAPNVPPPDPDPADDRLRPRFRFEH
jgi:hypothetical protein